MTHRSGRQGPRFDGRFPALLLAGMFVLAPGCSGTISQPLESRGDGIDSGDRRLDHGYGLLVPLLEDESKLAGILAIKSPRTEIADLLRKIAAEASSDLDVLRGLLARKPPVNPSESGLPVIEGDARTRIADEQTGILIFSSGRAFELRILLTQEKATGYAAALATSLSNADPQSERAEVLAEMARRWSELGDDVRRLLDVASDPESD